MRASGPGGPDRAKARKRIGPDSQYTGEPGGHLGRPRPGHVGDRCPGADGLNPLHCRRGAEHVAQVIGADEQHARRGTGDGAGRGAWSRPETGGERQCIFPRPIDRLISLDSGPDRRTHGREALRVTLLVRARHCSPLTRPRAAEPPRVPAGQTAPDGPAVYDRGYRSPCGSACRSEHGIRGPESRQR